MIINDKNNSIDFHLKLENASREDVSTRMLVEVEGKTTIVPVDVDDKLFCKAAIPLKEEYDNKIGKIIIEVVCKDVYFKLYEERVTFDVPTDKPRVGLTEASIGTAPVVKEGKKLYDFSAAIDKAEVLYEKHRPRTEEEYVDELTKMINRADAITENSRAGLNQLIEGAAPKKAKAKTKKDLSEFMNEAENFFTTDKKTGKKSLEDLI